MNRRAFLASLAALPAVVAIPAAAGTEEVHRPPRVIRYWETAPGVRLPVYDLRDLDLRPGEYRVVKFDGTTGHGWMTDMWCPRGTIVIGMETCIVSTGDLA